MTPEQAAEIDSQLAAWRQGDAVLGADMRFVYLADLAAPVTQQAEQLADEEGPDGIGIVSVETVGLVVVSQTCDIVRACRDRPFVEVCPLVSLPDRLVPMVRRNRVSQFVGLPGLGNANMAADLDRVMTVEKGLLASLTERRTRGVDTETEAQILAETLGRKRMRPAFPNDFVTAIEGMRQRIIEKRDKDSPEGDFLNNVREIRVLGIPDWISATIEVEFLFIFERGVNIPSDAKNWIERLLKRVAIGDRIAAVEGRPVGLDQLSAASYLDSYRLELDHLSQGTE